MALRAIQSPFPSNFANGNTPYHIFNGINPLLNHKGHRITQIAQSPAQALEKHIAANTLYLSGRTGNCVCGDHVSLGGAYLQAEVEQPNETVSTRIDGIIATPLDEWLVITPDAVIENPEEFDGITCDECDRKPKRNMVHK